MQPFPFQIVDLTHTLDENIPSWNGSCGFRHEIKLDYASCKTDVKFRVQQIKMHAGIGTHIDAPRHCYENGIAVAELSLENLLAPCVVIDVSEKADAHFTVTPADIEAFENSHGTIEPGSFVIIRTGWEKFWQEPERYRNNHCFPSISGQSAELLVKRGSKGLGIDTLSPDRPESGYPVHKIILGEGLYIIENIAHLHVMPPKGAYCLAMPIKTKEGAEAPIRFVGFKKKANLLDL